MSILLQNFPIYLIYVAVIARAIGWNYETFPIPAAIWILLALFGIILFSEHAITSRYPRYPRIYVVVQSVNVILMLYLTPTIDFLPMLFFTLSFQVVQFFHSPVGFIWIGGFSVAMMGMILAGLEWQAGLTLVLANTAVNVLMGSYAYLITKTTKERQDNQRLFSELHSAYQKLRDSAAQSEELAAVAERHQLVRELHDSLTQTLFSMNLAAQAAQLAIEEDPHQADEQLVRLQILARNAASEVQALTGQSPDHPLIQGGLSSALQKLAAERLALVGLIVQVEITGQRELTRSTEQNLYRIVQEALNNVTRHAGVDHAIVRVCLEGAQPFLEVIDRGCGFDFSASQRANGIGLVGMSERASEIGWELTVESQPGKGTRIHVEEKPV